MAHPLRYVRPDLVMRTSVLEPTVTGYQPVEAAQNVATQFTRIYGPTVWQWKQRNGLSGFGQNGDAVPPVYTQKGAMNVARIVGARNNKEAVAAIAQAFSRGESVRIRDNKGRVAVAHPGPKDRHTFFTSVINKARDAAGNSAAWQRGNGPLPFSRDTSTAPTVPARPRQVAPVMRSVPSAGVAVVRAAPAPHFQRSAQAANMILQNRPSALPNASVWLPPYAGGRREDPGIASAAALLATRLTRGPQGVTRPAVANALDAFRRTGRYF